MIDKTILDNARSIDLITFLEHYKGFHFRHFNGEYRPAEHTSLAVKSNRLSWYWHSKGIGGYGAIDFLMKIEGYDFKGAMTLLADEPTSAPLPSPTADIQRDFIIQSNTGAYRADNRLSLGGTSGIALAHYLQQHTHITELVFCLDNDDVGRKRAVRLAREYADKGYYTRLELPTLKDYNEVLLQYRDKQKKQKRLEGIYER